MKGNGSHAMGAGAALGGLGRGMEMEMLAGMNPMSVDGSGIPGIGVGLEGVGMMEGMTSNPNAQGFGGNANANASALMSLLNSDGVFDMNALFGGGGGGAEFNPSGMVGLGGGGIGAGLANSLSPPSEEKVDGGPSAMVGIVTSP